MGIFVQNINTSLRFSLNVLKFCGFLPKETVGVRSLIVCNIYRFLWFMFLIGGSIISQTGTMFQIWGDLTLMTRAAFLLFTNLAMATKLISMVVKRKMIQDIIDKCEEDLRCENRAYALEIIKRCNRSTTSSLGIYMCLALVTVFGWSAGVEKNQLPLIAWYPYDTSKSPIYELTYANQTSSLITSAMVNVCLDILVTSLIAVCSCRLKLVALSLRTVCDNVQVFGRQLLHEKDEEIIRTRVQQCVAKHNDVLKCAQQLQMCFSYPILAQFIVSIIIICVTAYHLALELINKNWILIISMVTYLLCMIMQVFLYCYRGNQLTEESSEIAVAAYWCPWYMCSVRLRRALLIVMVRSSRVTKLTAGGFTTLSLACFVSIIKASYTFFTVLKRVENRNEK